MTINVVYVEDNPSDVELFKSIVETSSDNISITIVDTIAEFESILEEKPDIIVSDFNLTGFDGIDILNIAKNKAPEIPFIFFSSTIGEENAVNLIHQGATDFVLKENITKIPHIIERAFNEWQIRKEKVKIKEELDEKIKVLGTLYNSLTDLVILKDADGIITQANNAFCDFFKTTLQNALGRKESHFFDVEESNTADQHVLAKRDAYNYEADYITEIGERKILEIIKSPVEIDSKVVGIVAVMRDITERRLLEEQNSKDRYILQQAENQTRSGSFEFDPENDILQISPNFKRLLKLRTDRNFISKTKLISCIHPEDRAMFFEMFDRSINELVEFELDHRYTPVGETDYRYSRTVLKPYPGPQFTIFYGTMMDTTEVREASIALLSIQDEERERISKELHDNVGQKLSASSMFLDAEEKDIAKIKGLVDEAISDIRNLSKMLTSSILDHQSFSEALETLIDRTPNAHLIELIADYDDKRIAPTSGKQLYRVLQEALNNAAKYSAANRIIVELSENNGVLHVSLSDDGIGFNLNTSDYGNGIRNMKERIRNINGDFQIESTPGNGTIISIKIPINHV